MGTDSIFSMMYVGKRLKEWKLLEIVQDFDMEHVLNRWKIIFIMTFFAFYAGKWFYMGMFFKGNMYTNHTGEILWFFYPDVFANILPHQSHLTGVSVKPQAATMGFCLCITLTTYLIVHTVHIDDLNCIHEMCEHRTKDTLYM
jgi:hypothetical protein